MELGKKIASLRKVKNITQAQLAEYLSVNPQTVSRWEAEGGTPDVMLLPKIACFFGISLDELFGTTDMEQINNLVYKYSVLRDEKSFEEVMRSMELALNSLHGELEEVKTDKEEIRQKIQQLKAWKVHIYIQKSRGAIEIAEKELDELRKEIESENPLYLPLKLQKQQFRIQMGDAVLILKQTQTDWNEHPSIDTLYCYMSALFDAQRCAEILSLWETSAVQKFVEDITEENDFFWQIMFESALMEQNLEFFQRYFTKYKLVASEKCLFEVKWMYYTKLQNTFSEEEKEMLKAELLDELERLNFNPYIKEWYRKKIKKWQF